MFLALNKYIDNLLLGLKDIDLQLFINFDEMKAYINLYVKDNELGKRFESICKFVKY